MPTIRLLAIACIQNLGEIYDRELPGSNNNVYGSTWGALLPGYDGLDRLGFRRERTRSQYPTEVMDPTIVEPLPQQSTEFSRARVAPSYWWQPQLFDLSPDPTVTFLAAWSTKANMGDGFNVQ